MGLISLASLTHPDCGSCRNFTPISDVPFAGLGLEGICCRSSVSVVYLAWTAETTLRANKHFEEAEEIDCGMMSSCHEMKK